MKDTVLNSLLMRFKTLCATKEDLVENLTNINDEVGAIFTVNVFVLFNVLVPSTSVKQIYHD